MKEKYILPLTILMIVTLLCVCRFSCNLKTADGWSDRYSSESVSADQRENVIEGRIVDRNGILLTSTSEYGENAYCVFESFEYLVGFNDPQYGSFGLRRKYADFLFSPGQDGRGAQIELTLDSALQEFIYDKMATEYNMFGSVIVIERKSGRILSMASHCELQLMVNHLDGELIECVFGESAENEFLVYGYMDTETPGSTYKMITASAIMENGMENEVYTDTGVETINSLSIYNAHKRSFGEVTLKDAFANSVNTYFAHYAAMLGCEVINGKAADFMIGEDIELDFTTLHSELGVQGEAPETAAMIGFGQGDTKVTPLHLAMIALAVSDGGTMRSPYMIDNINQDGEILFQGSSEVLIQSVSEETAEAVKELMRYTAVSNYEITDSKYGCICAKTGTAELTNGMDHAYFVSFNDDYVVVASKNNTDDFGISLKPMVLEIYDYLLEMIK